MRETVHEPAHVADVLRDITAAVKALLRGDGTGFQAVQLGIENQGLAFGLAAMVLAIVIRQATPPLSPGDVDGLLAAASAKVLDQAFDDALDQAAGR
jgi:hypothetical protein